jgi:hypothetical protein
MRLGCCVLFSAFTGRPFGERVNLFFPNAQRSATYPSARISGALTSCFSFFDRAEKRVHFFLSKKINR